MDFGFWGVRKRDEEEEEMQSLSIYNGLGLWS